MWRKDSKKEQILTEAKEETTRLGENWVWTTDMFVQREGKAKRNPIEEIDEADIFKGAANSLIMEQTYMIHTCISVCFHAVQISI